MAAFASSPTGSERVRLLPEDDEVDAAPPPAYSDRSFKRNIQRVRKNRTSRQATDVYPLTTFRKLAYGIGGVFAAVANALVAFYFNPFMLEVSIIDSAFISIIVFTGRLWDASTDPIIGFLASRTSSRFGKYRPWLFLATPLATTAYVMLWFVPLGSTKAARQAFAMVLYYCFQTTLSCFYVPYTTLTVSLSYDEKKRDLATTFRMAFESLSVILGIGIQTLNIGSGSSSTCTSCNATVVNSTLPLYGGVTEVAVSPELQQARDNFFQGGLWIGGVMLFCGWFCAIFVREQPLRAGGVQRGSSLRRSLKAVCQSREFLCHVGTYAMAWMAVNISTANLVLYAQYANDTMSEYVNTMIFVLTASTVGSMPFWLYLSRKVGKKTMYQIGLVMFMLPCFFWYFTPRETGPEFIYPVALFAGFGVGSQYLAPWLLLPVVVDDCAIRTGERHEAVMYTMFVFIMKFAAGSSIALSTLLLKASGYVSALCCEESQPEGVELVLRSLLGWGVLAPLLLALVFVTLNPLNKAREKEIVRVKADAVEKKLLETDTGAEEDAPFQ